MPTSVVEYLDHAMIYVRTHHRLDTFSQHGTSFASDDVIVQRYRSRGVATTGNGNQYRVRSTTTTIGLRTEVVMVAIGEIAEDFLAVPVFLAPLV